MTISLKLLQSNATIEKNINKALAEHFNTVLKKGSKDLKTAIKNKIPRWIAERLEVKSLLDEGVTDSLNAHFGLPKRTSSGSVNAILHAISASIIVKITPIKNNLKGGIEFSIQPANFANLLILPAGHVATERGGDLHWLDWLLNQGSAMIIKGYEYTPSYDGRSGGGIMSKGSTWRVPPQFAGIMNNNFITKALSNREKELTVILKGVFR